MAEPSASAARPAGPLAGLKARLDARPDTEHEQGILRLVIGAVLVLYLLPGSAIPSSSS